MIQSQLAAAGQNFHTAIQLADCLQVTRVRLSTPIAIPQCIAHSHRGNKHNRTTNPNQVSKKCSKLSRWAKKIKIMLLVSAELAPNPTCIFGKSPNHPTILCPILIPRIRLTFADLAHTIKTR